MIRAGHVINTGGLNIPAARISTTKIDCPACARTVATEGRTSCPNCGLGFDQVPSSSRERRRTPIS